MEIRRSAELAAFVKRVEKVTMEVFEAAPAEVFKWVGWASAIAALQVVDIRTESAWLQWLALLLSLLLIARMQWFLYDRLGLTKHPEEVKPDGATVTRLGWLRLFLSIPLCGLVYLFALGLPPVIAASDLLPPVREEATAAAKPSAPPQAAAKASTQATTPTKQP